LKLPFKAALNMNDDSFEKLMALPTDWWQKAGVSAKLAEWFSNYFLALVIDFEYSGEIRHHIFSGFLVSLGELSLWFTAGHIIDDLKTVLSKSGTRIIRARWWDRLPISGAESIPITSGLEAFSSKEIGIPNMDFGIIRISGLEEINLKRNNRVRFFTPQAWQNGTAGQGHVGHGGKFSCRGKHKRVGRGRFGR
jgi:hypothetical protein